MRAESSRLFGGTALAILALSAAACGNGGGHKAASTSPGRSSPEQWANAVCSFFITWRKPFVGTSIDDTQLSMRKAERLIESRTEMLARSLRELGRPDTAAGEAAKKNLDALATTVQNSANRLKEIRGKDKTAAGAAAESAAIAATYETIRKLLQLVAGGNLKNFAPSGELARAFHQAHDCRRWISSFS